MLTAVRWTCLVGAHAIGVRFIVGEVICTWLSMVDGESKFIVVQLNVQSPWQSASWLTAYIEQKSKQIVSVQHDTKRLQFVCLVTMFLSTSKKTELGV